MVQFQKVFEDCHVESFNLLIMRDTKTLFIRSSSQPKVRSNLLDSFPVVGNTTDSRVPSPYKRYVIDKHLFDTGLALDWLEDCNQKHPQCRPPTSLKINLKEVIFVDTIEECIVSIAPDEVKFTALSYVWGQCEMTKTTSRNLTKLKRTGSLSPASPDTILPRTVRDAMRLTRKLGLRYLWVDCFSIIQDDPHVSKYLDAMGQIYANAYVTIIVASGKDAEHGIKGLSGEGSPRIFFGHVLRFPSYQLKLRHAKDPNNIAQITQAPWSARAWTFQEGYFSNRALLFTDQMAFLCRNTYREESAINRQNNRVDSSRLEHICQLSREHLAWPRYANLVEEFNGRVLSFENDIVGAFAGIMDHFARAEDIQPGYKFIPQADSGARRQFIFGHPLELSAKSLLWRGKHGNTLRRRDWSNRIRDFVIPSWSWLAWHGPLSLEDWERDIELSFEIQKYCTSCDKSSVLDEACCLQKEIDGISKYSPCVSIRTEHARFNILYSRATTDAGVFDPTIPTRAVGEVQFDHALSIDLLEHDPSPSTIPSGFSISSTSYDFIAIGVGRRGFRRIEEWRRRDPDDDSGLYVYALCVEWKIGNIANLAERMGVAVIEQEVWAAASKTKMEVVLE